jgi:hypothetical protein
MGWIEDILVTPLSREALIRDPWRVLLRAYGRPFLVFWILGVAIQGAAFSSQSPAGVVEQFLFGAIVRFPMDVVAFAAPGWLAMWLAWSSQRPEHAALKAFLIVMLLALFASVLSIPVMQWASSWARSFRFPWWGLAFSAGPQIAIQGAVLLWARHRLTRAILGRSPSYFPAWLPKLPPRIGRS